MVSWKYSDIALSWGGMSFSYVGNRAKQAYWAGGTDSQTDAPLNRFKGWRMTFKSCQSEDSSYAITLSTYDTDSLQLLGTF